MRRKAGVALAVLALSLGVSACAPVTDGAIVVSENTVIIDVRTPAEFADGHLDGAVNLDVQSAAFVTEIATLDPERDYVVYCRSGSRSAHAADLLEAEGLTVHDGGSLHDAARATDREIVR